MAQITVDIDPTLAKKDITMIITNSSPDEAGQSYVPNKQDVMQTSIFGVLTPLIKIDDIIVDFMYIDQFELSSKGPLPMVSMSFEDRFRLIENFSTPTNDNIIQVQIIPQFEGAYKKINLEFYISRINISGTYVTLTGTYKLPELFSSQFKSLGNISTYDLCKKIANETGLGLASNDKSTSDQRWIYCNHMSYKDLLSREITTSIADESHIYDYWVDFWDYLNLVNIYERYNSVDGEEDMKVWVSGLKNILDEQWKPSPQQVHCALTNHPVYGQNDLFIIDYQIVNKSGNQLQGGTDRVFSVYDKDLGEYKDTLLQNGDTKQDIFRKYEYAGETMGGYNYFVSGELRRAYLQKMTSETLEVTLGCPMLGISRGSKVDVLIYDDDTMLNTLRENATKAGILDETMSNLPVNIDNDNNGEILPVEDQLNIKKHLSGQYYVMGTNLRFEDGVWRNTLILSRPADTKSPQLIKSQDDVQKTNRNINNLRS